MDESAVGTEQIGHALLSEPNVSRQIKSSFICIVAIHSRSQLNASLVNRAGSELLFTGKCQWWNLSNCRLIDVFKSYRVNITPIFFNLQLFHFTVSAGQCERVPESLWEAGAEWIPAVSPRRPSGPVYSRDSQVLLSLTRSVMSGATRCSRHCRVGHFSIKVSGCLCRTGCDVMYSHWAWPAHGVRQSAMQL